MDKIIRFLRKSLSVNAFNTVRRMYHIMINILFFYKIVLGFWPYHFSPRKTVVLIVGSMRSGSTLLKALLAEAPDVPNLPEIEYNKYKIYNRYAIYYKIYKLSKKRVVVLKKPGLYSVPFSREFVRLKIIILTRNVVDCAKSLKVMNSTWDAGKAVDYWCDVYENILRNKRLLTHNVIFVKYEDLVNNPKKITKKIFAFIGSVQKQGLDHYKKPESFDWDWGIDDGGDKIKSLKIQGLSTKEKKIDKKLLNVVKSSDRVESLMKRFGYNYKWKET